MPLRPCRTGAPLGVGLQLLLQLVEQEPALLALFQEHPAVEDIAWRELLAGVDLPQPDDDDDDDGDHIARREVDKLAGMAAAAVATPNPLSLGAVPAGMGTAAFGADCMLGGAIGGKLSEAASCRGGAPGAVPGLAGSRRFTVGRGGIQGARRAGVDSY
eukprot:4775319-Prymnesium_polylepis.1